MPFINGCGGIRVNSQTKACSPTKNQTTIMPDEGYNAMSQFTLKSTALQTKTISSNGTFVADDNYLAFDKVIVRATKRACYSREVVSTGGSSTSGGIAINRTFIFAIPMGDNLTLPSTILIHIDRVTNPGFAYDQSRTLIGAVWTKNEDDTYTGLLFGGVQMLISNNMHDDGRMSPPVNTDSGTVSTTEDSVILTFTAKGVNNDADTSTLNPEIGFANIEGNKYSIISIWN